MAVEDRDAAQSAAKLLDPTAPTARAKHLPLLQPAPSSDPPELVPARMINEVLYCERLLYLEWAQGEFADNYFTVDGRAAHRRADQPGGALPPVPVPGSADDDPDPETSEEPNAAPPYKARSLWLSSETLGITAKIDIVEGDANGHVVPIEYKRGHPPEIPEQAYLPERAQLCAQVLLLRDHGYLCDEAQIYFAAARKRVNITIDDALIEITKAAVLRAKELVAQVEMPPPLCDSPKCNGCSLVGICLPDEVNLLARLEGRMPVESEAPAPDQEMPDLGDPTEGDPWGLAGTVQPEGFELRRLHPSRDDQVPLYVQEQGARIGLSGEKLVVTGRVSGKLVARLPNTSQVCLMGNVQISTQAIRELCERGIPLSFFSSGGWYYGRAGGFSSKNIELRVRRMIEYGS